MPNVRTRSLPWPAAVLLAVMLSAAPPCRAVGAARQPIDCTDRTPEYIAPRVAARPVQAYPFVHADGCTGECEYVVVDGKQFQIRFTPDSDADAQKLLYALKSELFLPNTNDSPRLYVVGQLFDGISREAQGPCRANDPGGYHEFLLARWYLVAPFWEDKRHSNDRPVMTWPDEEAARYKPRLRRKLRRSDFDQVDGMKIDLDALVLRKKTAN